FQAEDGIRDYKVTGVQTCALPICMRDVIAHMGDAFWRLRIGIGHPGDRSAVLDYVLGRPNAADAELIREALLVAADAVPVLLTEGAQSAMNRLHSRGPSPGEPPATNS